MVHPLICWFKRWIISPAALLPELSMVSRILVKNVFTLLEDGLVKTLPQRYRRTFCPKKSKPSSTCVIWVFSWESSKPRSFKSGKDTHCDASYCPAGEDVRSPNPLIARRFGSHGNSWARQIALWQSRKFEFGQCYV